MKQRNIDIVHRRQAGLLRSSHGAVAVMVALLLVILVGMGALAVDVGYIMVNRNELQNVADAAALAATRQLGVLYGGMTYVQMQSYVVGGTDESLIKGAATSVAFSNQAGGVNIVVDPDEVMIGTWDPSRIPDAFSQGNSQPDAVRVTARRDQQLNNPVATFFARVFGIQSAPVAAVATAALSGQSTAGPGGLPVPVGISRYWFDNQPLFNFCNQPIRFYPTNDPTSCAGWHLYDRYSNFNDSRLRDTISDLRTGRYESPEVTANDTQFEFGGGTMSTHTFNAMLQLFQANLNRDLNNDGIMDAWETSVPVYESSNCSNPHGEITIVGFATIVITGVQSSPVHQIDGYVICNNFEPGRSGGGDFGTMGTIPGLVQ